LEIPEAEWPSTDSTFDATRLKQLNAQALGVEIEARFGPGFLSSLGWPSLRRVPTTTR
jgi:hypothetical protein